MARKDPPVETSVRALRSLRRRPATYRRLADTVERLGDIAMELRAAPDRLAVMRLAEERKAIAALAESLATLAEAEALEKQGREVAEVRRAQAQNRHGIARVSDAPKLPFHGDPQ